MLIRDVDCDEDPDRWRAFLVDQGFGHFVAAGSGRAVPVVVPTQYVLTDTEIVFHLVATNPVFAALEENPRARDERRRRLGVHPRRVEGDRRRGPGPGNPHDVLRGRPGHR